MTETTGEMTAPVEQKKNVVSRVAERVGKFLSETYTVKGATAKEMEKYAYIYDQFSGKQRDEMMAYYDKSANQTASWKVVRNWVATGAGLAAGGATIAFHEAAWSAITGAAGVAAGWFATEAVAFQAAIMQSGSFVDKVKNIWNLFLHPNPFKGDPPQMVRG